MARKTKEHAEKTRDLLLDAAEIIFLRKGVSRSSLEEIAAQAGMTRGALYWHFENKLDLLRAMHHRVKAPMDAMFDELTSGEEALAGLKTMCLHVFDKIENDVHARNLFTIMRLRCEDHLCGESEYAQEMWAKRQEVYGRFNRAFTQIQKKHPLADGMTPELASIACHVFISGVFWDFLTARGPYQLSILAEPLVDNFFRGVLKHT